MRTDSDPGTRSWPLGIRSIFNFAIKATLKTGLQLKFMFTPSWAQLKTLTVYSFCETLFQTARYTTNSANNS